MNDGGGNAVGQAAVPLTAVQSATRRSARRIVGAAALLLLVGGPRPAGALDLGLAIAAAHERVTEFRQDGSVFLKEQGGTARLRMFAEAVPESTGLGWYVRGALGRASLDYKGQTQSGAPYTTTTEYRLREAALGALIAIDRLPQIGLGVLVEERDRTILGKGAVRPLEEHYRLRWAELAVRRRFESVELALSGLKLVDYHQAVASPGAIDRTELNRAQGSGFSLSVSAGRPGWFGMAGIPGIRGLRIGIELHERRTTRSESVTYYRNGVAQDRLAQPATRRASVGTWIEAGF